MKKSDEYYKRLQQVFDKLNALSKEQIDDLLEDTEMAYDPSDHVEREPKNYVDYEGELLVKNPRMSVPLYDPFGWDDDDEGW